jgi:hypothetical protein
VTARILIAAAILLAAEPAFAVPEQLTLSAQVSDDGTRIDGEHGFVVRIFTSETGGNAVWSETDTATAADGQVYLTLGDQEALDSTVIDGGPLWIELQVDSTVLSPRLAVTSAPYAMHAGLCEDAERLGGLTADDFAAADHDHAGAYLPVGATLGCNGSDKVIGIDPATGSVVCGSDVDTDTDTTLTLAGNGLASTAARSDHNHVGSYIQVSGIMSCPAGSWVSAINSLGQVSCVSGPAFAGSGLANTMARSDHNHIASTCPAGFTGYVAGPTRICIRGTTINGPFTWYVAAKECLLDGGANLCRHEQILRAQQIHPTLAIALDYWMGDRTQDDYALLTADIAGSNIDIDANVHTTHAGYYCCIERTWF